MSLTSLRSGRTTIVGVGAVLLGLGYAGYQLYMKQPLDLVRITSLLTTGVGFFLTADAKQGS